jgi:hypothetical protein
MQLDGVGGGAMPTHPPRSQAAGACGHRMPYAVAVLARAAPVPPPGTHRGPGAMHPLPVGELPSASTSVLSVGRGHK